MHVTPCAYEYPLRILSRKWSFFVLRTLQQPKSFGDLSHELRHVTNHTLARELKLLQAEGLVEHNNTYAITPRGNALLTAAEPLMHWSVAHAGRQSCPREKSCTGCLTFPVTIGAREYRRT